jgi:hypothetical protein
VRGLVIYGKTEEVIRAELDDAGCDGDAATLTPGPDGGFILTGEEAEKYATHLGLVTTEISDVSPQQEVPVLNSIDPSTAVLGDPDVTMTCVGSKFTPNSVIMFADNPEPITFVSSSEISTIVKPSLGWGAVSVPVFVKNGLKESAKLSFTFTEPLGRKGLKAKRK